MQERYLQNTGLLFPDLPTFESAESTTSARSISSAEGSPVRMFRLPESVQESTENEVASGLSSIESFASYDPDTCSLKTSQVYLFQELSEFSETWPRAGTMRSGKCFRLPVLGRSTKENGSLSLPTPTASDAETHPNDFQRFQSLQASLHRLLGKGFISPCFVEWMMNFPITWTELRDSGTP